MIAGNRTESWRVERTTALILIVEKRALSYLTLGRTLTDSWHGTHWLVEEWCCTCYGIIDKAIIFHLDANVWWLNLFLIIFLLMVLLVRLKVLFKWFIMLFGLARFEFYTAEVGFGHGYRDGGLDDFARCSSFLPAVEVWSVRLRVSISLLLKVWTFLGGWVKYF